MAKLLSRDKIEDKYKWKLEHIIASDNEWEALYSSVLEKKDICLKYKGKLSDTTELLECLDSEIILSKDSSRLYIYSKMKSDQDTTVSLYRGMADRAEMLLVTLNSINSFIVPEITLMSKERILELSDMPEFSDYSVLFKDIARNKDHILGEPEEKILAESGIFSSGFQDTYTMLNNADITFDSIKGEDGTLKELTHGSYSEYLISYDRAVRRRAFKAYYKSYKSLINTIASNYSGNVKKNSFYAKVRKYNNALENSMNSENVDKAVYEKLLKAVSANTKSVHEYVKLRKKVLKLSRIHMYDMYVPLISGSELKLDYEEAYELVISALKPLGEEYINTLKEAFSGGWIDVYENKHKRSGAYAWGSYGSHPYVLLNYKKTTHDIFTIAHELGHAMHSFNSNLAQPFTKAGYEIFVAEVASTVNELLLLKYLTTNGDQALKKYLLSYLLDTIRTTLFRQTMFAEFEKNAHDMLEGGIPLTPDSLSEMYYNLNVKYYGKEVSDEDIRYEWSRIPHFYTSFYVYKYATGITSAIMIADKILTEEGYVNKYYDFLRAGGSLPPLEILKLCDIDLMSDEPYNKAMELFNNTLKELKKAI